VSGDDQKSGTNGLLGSWSWVIVVNCDNPALAFDLTRTEDIVASGWEAINGRQ
jgi:hypothetical protein